MLTKRDDILKLRETVLTADLDESSTADLNENLNQDLTCLENLEALFRCEMERKSSNPAVVSFCIRGLKRFAPYSNKIELPEIEELYAELNRRRDEAELEKSRATRVLVHRKSPKRRIIAFTAAFTVLLLTVATSADLFYDSNRAFWKAMEAEDHAYIDPQTGRETVIYDYDQTYNSFEEMAKAENVSAFLYPQGREFTDFLAVSHKGKLELLAYSREPWITFTLNVGETVPEGLLTREINGVKYGIVDFVSIENGLYFLQAMLNYNGDYYSVVVSDGDEAEDALINIIKNLTEVVS